MTYKGSNWTRGELGHDINRNPLINCGMCGESYRYRNYWCERYVDGKSWRPDNVEWLCDECMEHVKREYELHKKKRANAQLTEFTA
jgi:hypothetical protein